MTKSSKKKQKLYERFLKSVLHGMNRNKKIIRIFSKKLKRKQRKYTTSTNYLNVLEILKKTWNVIKDIIGKSKIKSTNHSRKLTINKVDVYDQPEIADAFNDFFTSISQKLASQIQNHLKHLKHISIK